MATVFLSHSSKDKDFVRRLANDLTEMGHTPWLDERDIRAGESIVGKVGEGVAKADYVVIVLSNNSVQSGWFAREWEAKLWQEINQGKTMVIPVLFEDCEIPLLLQPKKYADFRKSYTKGFVELMGGISPILPGSHAEIQELNQPEANAEISILLSKLQSRTTTLGQCLSEGLAFALRTSDAELADFCKQELQGLKSGEAPSKLQSPPHRTIEMYVSMNEINMQSFLWNNVGSIFAYMRQHPTEFVSYRTVMEQSVPVLEAQELPDPNKSMIHLQSTLGRVMKNAPSHLMHAPVWIYGRSDAFRTVLEAIRQRFTELLLERLPGLDASDDSLAE